MFSLQADSLIIVISSAIDKRQTQLHLDRAPMLSQERSCCIQDLCMCRASWTKQQGNSKPLEERLNGTWGMLLNGTWGMLLDVDSDPQYFPEFGNISPSLDLFSLKERTETQIPSRCLDRHACKLGQEIFFILANVKSHMKRMFLEMRWAQVLASPCWKNT